MDVTKVRIQAFGKACRLVIDNTSGRAEELSGICREELSRLEQKFSSFKPDSVVSRINQAAGTGAFVPLDAESSSLFNYVEALWSKSQHLFDPTTCILRDCYVNGQLRASREQLQGMVTLVGLRHLELSDSGAHLTKKGMLIDLNSCVRPYAVDCLKKILLREGARHALIEMDQDIASIGKQPGGANWLVGVRLPKGSSAAISRLKLNDCGYAMRGDFEHTTTMNGERFGRALSPVDGQPVPGLLSVIVIGENCLAACSAASVARMKTQPSAIKWLATLGMPWLAVDRELNCHGPLARTHP